MPFSRRQLLQAAATWPILRTVGLAQTTPRTPFAHGVASGDPLADAVMIWTRVSPDAPRSAADAVDVRWEVADDDRFRRIVRRGSARTSARRDHTVKADVGGLDPGRTYFYRFDAAGERSPVGRTRTLPRQGVARVQLASVCCANYPAGYFNVYRAVAERDDLDAVVHLGDYIYEFPNGVFGDGTATGRLPDPPGETVTLDEYRRRYAIYHTDPDLQAAHARHPFIAVWDDHELADNAWRGGATNHDPSTEGPWSTRRAAAYQAYLEWMPVRESVDTEPHLYRAFAFGGLLDLCMLDTRGLRDAQVAATDAAGLADANRTLLGPVQEQWLVDQLRASMRRGAAWRVLGQQVMFAPATPPGMAPQNTDLWDGYPAARSRVLDQLAADRIADVAILSGDIHSSWAFDVPPDPWHGYDAATGSGSRAVELVTPAISSPPLFADPRIRAAAGQIRALLPHLKFLDGERHGYVLLDATSTRLLAEWHAVGSVAEPGSPASRMTAFACERGAHRLVPA